MNRTQYLLTILAEECAETAQRATKGIRFGLAECQPGQELTNRQRLEEELGDLMGLADMLGLIPNVEKRAAKPDRVRRYADLSVRADQITQQVADGLLLNHPRFEINERVRCGDLKGTVYDISRVRAKNSESAWRYMIEWDGGGAGQQVEHELSPVRHHLTRTYKVNDRIMDSYGMHKGTVINAVHRPGLPTTYHVHWDRGGKGRVFGAEMRPLVEPCPRDHETNSDRLDKAFSDVIDPHAGPIEGSQGHLVMQEPIEVETPRWTNKADVDEPSTPQ